MALQDLFGSAVQAYDQRRQLETERAWQTQQRQGTLAALERQQREARLKALQAQGEAFLNAGMVDQAARLVPQATSLQGQLAGTSFEAPAFVGEPAGPGQPNNLNNPRTDAAVRAWLGVEPQKPMAVAFGTSLVDPRTGRAVYDGTAARAAEVQVKGEQALEVAELRAKTSQQIAAERIAAAEKALGARLTASESQFIRRIADAERRDAERAANSGNSADRAWRSSRESQVSQLTQAWRTNNRKPAVGPDGKPLTDANGAQLYTYPSPQEIEAASRRIREEWESRNPPPARPQ